MKDMLDFRKIIRDSSIHLLQQRKLNTPISINTDSSSEENSVKIRYGFKNNTIDKVPKSVLVTQRPYRNSVLISTTKTATKMKKIEEKSINNTKDDDFTVYKFLKSIVKLG